MVRKQGLKHLSNVKEQKDTDRLSYKSLLRKEGITFLYQKVLFALILSLQTLL